MWQRAGAPLVVAELAIAMILLVSAGLLAKSLYRLLHVDTGFNVEQLAMLSVSPVSVSTGSSNESEPTGALAEQVAERVAAVPGVVSVGYADLLPLAPGLAPTSTFWVRGRSETISSRKTGPFAASAPAISGRCRPPCYAAGSSLQTILPQCAL